MKLSKQEEAILWNKVDENMELVQKITHDAQFVADKKIVSNDKNQLELTASSLNQKNFKITKKLIAHSFKEQQQKAKLMRNKMAYMHLVQLKQQKAFELTKRNMLRIANIRRNSIQERQNLNKLRQSLSLEQSQANQIKTRQIKSSRKSRQKAIEKWRTSVQQTAQGARAQMNLYHTICCQQKKQQCQINTEKVEKVKQSLQRSRISIQKAATMKIEETKLRYKYDLQQRYNQLASQKRKNERLYEVFKAQTERANNWQQLKKKQINQFRSLWVQNHDNPESISSLELY